MEKISRNKQEILDESFSKQEELTRKFLIELILGHNELVLSLANSSGKTSRKPVPVEKDGLNVMVGPVTNEHLRLAPAYDYLFRWIVLSFGERGIDDLGKPTVNTASAINTLNFLDRMESEAILEKLAKDFEVNIPKRASKFFQSIKQNQSALKNALPATKGGSFLPPTLNNWSQVSFCTLSDGRFEIRAAGKNYAQDEIFGESPPTYLIKFLYQIIHKGGTFDNGSFGDIKNTTVREYKARLNKLLKEGFGINKA
ncbi:MAG TPA: hypothetical protein EYO37_08405, partial [Nitrospina sp.]|nr:hypothetical protein [Nitrospina sp.]